MNRTRTVFPFPVYLILIVLTARYTGLPMISSHFVDNPKSFKLTLLYYYRDIMAISFCEEHLNQKLKF